MSDLKRVLTAGVAVTLLLTACGDSNGSGAGEGSESETESMPSQSESAGMSEPEATLEPFVMGRFFAPTLILAGQEMGAFDDIEMETTDLDSGPAALPLLTTGELAGLADISEPPVVIAFARDIAMKVVWASNTTPTSLVMHEAPGSPDDLRGKKIAAPGGSIAQYLLEQYLSDNGLELSDIEFVDMAPPDMPGAFASGAIDGAFIWPPPATAMRDEGGTFVTTSPVTNMTVFSDEFIADHPDTVQAFVCDMADIHRSFEEDPSTVWAAIAGPLEMDTADVEPLVPEGTVVAIEDMVTSAFLGAGGETSGLAAQIAGVGQWLVDQGQLEKAPTAEEAVQMFDPQFAQGVLDGACS